MSSTADNRGKSETLPTPYYEDDAVTIYHGDCREILAGLGPFDLTVTSPPYNQLGSRVPKKPSGLHSNNAWMKRVDATGYSDDLSEGEYAEWQASVAAGIFEATRPGCSLFYNHKLRYRNATPIHPLDLVRSFEGWHMRQEIVWDQRRSMALNARMFAPCEERIYWLTKPGADYRWNQAALAMSVWPIPPGDKWDDSHPCPFPVLIPQRCIQATTAPGDLVLDPFMGSGTTLRAAKDLGRRAVGIEREERFCETAAQRMAQGVLDMEAA